MSLFFCQFASPRGSNERLTRPARANGAGKVLQVLRQYCTEEQPTQGRVKTEVRKARASGRRIDQPVVHVVVLASPAEELVPEPVDGLELSLVEGGGAAEDSVVPDSVTEKYPRVQYITIFII